MATEYKWDGQRDAEDIHGCSDCKKYLEDIGYLRGVIRDCLVFAGCEPSQPRAERKIREKIKKGMEDTNE